MITNRDMSLAEKYLTSRSHQKPAHLNESLDNSQSDGNSAAELQSNIYMWITMRIQI